MVRVAVEPLEQANIGYILFGGWAVDLHCGRQTRPHDDVDLLVPFDSRDRARRAYVDRGFEHRCRACDRFAGAQDAFAGLDLHVTCTYYEPGPCRDRLMGPFESEIWPVGKITVRSIEHQGSTYMVMGQADIERMTLEYAPKHLQVVLDEKRISDLRVLRDAVGATPDEG